MNITDRLACVMENRDEYLGNRFFFSESRVVLCVLLNNRVRVFLKKAILL